MDFDCDAEKVIRDVGTIEVTAYARKVVEPAQIKLWAERLADELNEWWPDEEYGNPDDDRTGPGDNQFVQELTTILQAAIDRTHVWQCEEVGKKEFSEEEVLAIMRQWCTGWFPEKKAAP